MTYDLIIIGGGASGLMAAAEAGRLKFKALVLERHSRPGTKLLMCGGGRCNATHIKVSEKDYSSGCVHSLRHVLAGFSSQDAVRFFERWGAPLALQPDGCYFSADDNARTVLNALLAAGRNGGTELRCSARVSAIMAQDNGFNVIVDEWIARSRFVLVTTGGLSYPMTGSDGFGYECAQASGHRIVSTRPALTPLIASSDLFASLAGIVVKVRLSLWAQGKRRQRVDGPFLFTHHGFSGPAALEMSRAWLDARPLGGEVWADFFPDSNDEGVDLFFQGSGQKSLKNILSQRLPERLALVLLAKAGVDGLKPPRNLSKDEKHSLKRVLRACPLPIGDVSGYAKAEITAGGVDLNELKGATMESRLQKGLYFAGEVVDVDGRIGGFNLHWAWASAVSAVRAMARSS